MKLAEIYVRLPEQAALLLEKLLEQTTLPVNPSWEEVHSAGKIVRSELRFFMAGAAHAHWLDSQTEDLLDALPEAIANEIAG
jgi:hypothetical protein